MTGSRRRLVVAVVAAIVVAAAGVTAARLTSDSGTPRAAGKAAATTVTVQRMNLAETTPVNGTVGFASPVSIVQPTGTPPSALNEAQQAVTSAQQTLAADRQAAAGTNWADAQSVAQARTKFAADQLNLAKAFSAAAAARTSQTAYGQTSMYSALPAVGQIIQPGQALWSIDGRPVALIPGTLAPWRAFSAGMSPGPDVAILDQALIALGDGAGLAVSRAFTAATGAAIERLQAILGQPQTGALPLGSVIFAPSALRVTAIHPAIGGPVLAGAPVLDVTSTTPIVNVALPVGQSYLVKVGDPVSVTLPENTTVQGTITAVGTVATKTNPPSDASGSSSSPPSATINVTVSMPGAASAASLDQAPVTVNITNGVADRALAVPTTALLPLAGGGYAVEIVQRDGTHRLVAVTTGIFDDQAGKVEVSGTGLAAGQTVVAAA